ncbi:VOC family protein [Fictibacillus phosphorivorans]|uniref:VOC family protein n=1 Tax=Fictibacillus phosphorivorans TaxID=1221500 RepID=UPI00203BC916|nr:VOC family protein [Fictibacillus phosphorivorans]MCM3719211.1 VOC family protein [Fictibacillus phosphorivorans]MCM3776833.1 VOC family protein [Fictibacillus phosphorivorans]
MKEKLVRVGTTYVPVRDPNVSARWYAEKLGAQINYQDDDKAIMNLADQSFFLVKAEQNESSNFKDYNGTQRFSLTFEVDGIDSLYRLHKEFKSLGIETGEIEDRGHAGENFVFCDPDGNKYDVWSELSPAYKKLRPSFYEEV